MATMEIMSQTDSHVTTVAAHRKEKRTVRYASCSCGWVGRSRGSQLRADADATAHERGTDPDFEYARMRQYLRGDR